MQEIGWPENWNYNEVKSQLRLNNIITVVLVLRTWNIGGYTHTYVYTHTYLYICMCVCMKDREKAKYGKEREGGKVVAQFEVPLKHEPLIIFISHYQHQLLCCFAFLLVAPHLVGHNFFIFRSQHYTHTRMKKNRSCRAE